MANLFNFPGGTSVGPTITFTSERSLGWYRSAASTIALSYGNLQMAPTSQILRPGAIQYWFDASPSMAAAVGCWDSGAATNFAALVFNIFNGSAWTKAARITNNTFQFEVTDGTALAPTLAFSSESSLGWYRSAASVTALSYGGIGIKAGTDASCGTAILGSNGSVNVATKYVAANDLIFLTDQTAGGTLGDIELGGIRAGSGFTILSTSITDTSTVAWLIVRPT